MVTSGKLWKVWFSIGVQSFGGGTTTMTLIRRSVVDQEKWVTNERFNRDFALCQMAPGINLIALTILLGRQVAGWRGAVIALAGLLLPSAFLTVLITAGFISIRNAPSVQATLRGILPASIGLGLVTSVQMAKQPLSVSKMIGYWHVGFALILMSSAGALLYFGVCSTPILLIGAGLIGAIESVVRSRIKLKEKAT